MENYQKHGGTWKLFDDETIYNGELHIDYEKRIIALELILPASEKKPMPRGPYIGKLPFICGTLFSGAKILLYDCQTSQEHTSFFQFTTQIIYANYAFWGLSVESIGELLFPQVIVDFGNIIAWSGLCKYKWEMNDNGNSDLLWSHNSPIDIKLKDDLCVTFYPGQGTIGGDMYKTEITATQYVKVEFIYNHPVPWETIIEDVKNIQYLIGLGVNQTIEIDTIEYCHDSILFEVPISADEGVKHYRPASMIIGVEEPRHITNDITNNNVYNYLYTLPQIIANNAIIKWCDYYHNLKPILDLYFISLSGIATTPEILFLNLTQALETYHARFITNNVKTYPSRVEALVKTFCSNEENTQRWQDYLLDESQKKNQRAIQLRTRLADLTFANGVLPFWPDGKLPKEYIRKVVDTRNYYTHYDSSKFDKAFTKEELPKVNGHLMTLLEYHLLVLLGFDPQETRRKTVQKIRRIDESYAIQNGIHKIGH